MKSRNHLLSIAIFFLVLVFSACKKETSQQVDFTSESSTHSDDQSRFSTEVDGIANDVNLALELTSGFTGRIEGIQSLTCDADIVVDTVSNPRTITFTYNGNNCLGYHTRTGVVVISMAQGVRWKNIGAVLNVTFQNLKITRLSDNKSITINGLQTYTNLSGGLLINLPVLGTITHTINSSNMSVTFDNGLQRNWKVARQRAFTYNNGVVITVTGTHNEVGISGISEWGINRFGNNFTTAITQPLIFKQDCSFRLGGGKVVHTTSLFNASATFGLDASGNSTSCPGIGSYFMKIEWTGPNGNTHTSLIPY
jgi:hypothetical protein